MEVGTMNQILKYNKIIVIVILLITIFFAFQIPKVEINNDIEVFLPDDHFTKVQNDRMKDIFGESDSIVAAVKVTRGSIFDRNNLSIICLLYTSPSPRDRQKSRMPSSA